jgi:hypothetical protein
MGHASYADFLKRDEIHPLIFVLIFFFNRNQARLLLKKKKKNLKYNAQ